MSTLVVAASLLFSVSILIALAKSDPKRLRTAGQTNPRNRPRNTRKLLTLSLLLPAIIFLMLSDWPSLLIWLGASCISGWIITLLFAKTH